MAARDRVPVAHGTEEAHVVPMAEGDPATSSPVARSPGRKAPPRVARGGASFARQAGVGQMPGNSTRYVSPIMPVCPAIT